MWLRETPAKTHQPAFLRSCPVPACPALLALLPYPRRRSSNRELERKEEKSTAEATKAWAQINCGASQEGQAIFDLFSKT